MRVDSFISQASSAFSRRRRSTRSPAALDAKPPIVCAAAGKRPASVGQRLFKAKQTRERASR